MLDKANGNSFPKSSRRQWPLGSCDPAENLPGGLFLSVNDYTAKNTVVSLWEVLWKVSDCSTHMFIQIFRADVFYLEEHPNTPILLAIS